MSKDKAVTQELSTFLAQRVRIRMQGGRELIGVLKGFDSVVNLVLDNCFETLRDSSNAYTDKLRALGLVVAKGTAVVCVSAEDGTQAIENPFAATTAANSS